MKKREREKRDRLDAEAEALFKASLFECSNCRTVFEATADACPYCQLPTGDFAPWDE